MTICVILGFCLCTWLSEHHRRVNFDDVRRANCTHRTHPGPCSKTPSELPHSGASCFYLICLGQEEQTRCLQALPFGSEGIYEQLLQSAQQTHTQGFEALLPGVRN